MSSTFPGSGLYGWGSETITDTGSIESPWLVRGPSSLRDPAHGGTGILREVRRTAADTGSDTVGNKSSRYT